LGRKERERERGNNNNIHLHIQKVHTALKIPFHPPSFITSVSLVQGFIKEKPPKKETKVPPPPVALPVS